MPCGRWRRMGRLPPFAAVSVIPHLTGVSLTQPPPKIHTCQHLLRVLCQELLRFDKRSLVWRGHGKIRRPSCIMILARNGWQTELEDFGSESEAALQHMDQHHVQCARAGVFLPYLISGHIDDGDFASKVQSVSASHVGLSGTDYCTRNGP